MTPRPYDTALPSHGRCSSSQVDLSKENPTSFVFNLMYSWRSCLRTSRLQGFGGGGCGCGGLKRFCNKHGLDRRLVITIPSGLSPRGTYTHTCGTCMMQHQVTLNHPMKPPRWCYAYSHTLYLASISGHQTPKSI